jgi:hypothetical protein
VKCDVAYLRAMRAPRILLMVVAAALVAACNKDNGTNPVEGGGPTPILYTLTVDTTLADTATATVGTQVPVRVHLSKAGVAVPGGTVTWKATLGSGKVSADSNVTDANGDASILWTVGDTAGLNTLAIASFDATTAYHAKGTPDVPSDLIRISADSSLVVSGAALPIAVRATDRLGNGSGGADVTWSATGGQITLTTTAAGPNGGATTVFITSAPGTYIVTATLAGHASLLFKVVAL